MTALEITEIGTLLTQMLKGDLFDHFLLQEAAISQAASYEIDGRIAEGFYTEEELEQRHLKGCRYLPFAYMRPTILAIMKGRQKPSFFKFVFLLSPENQASTIACSGSSYRTEDVSGMFLNLTYKNDRLICTTGVSYRVFSMDKSLESEWDRLAALFFRQHGIAVTEAK